MTDDPLARIKLAHKAKQSAQQTEQQLQQAAADAEKELLLDDVQEDVYVGELQVLELISRAVYSCSGGYDWSALYTLVAPGHLPVDLKVSLERCLSPSGYSVGRRRFQLYSYQSRERTFQDCGDASLVDDLSEALCRAESGYQFLERLVRNGAVRPGLASYALPRTRWLVDQLWGPADQPVRSFVFRLQLPGAGITREVAARDLRARLATAGFTNLQIEP
jgi:hypothetical protein